MEEKEQRRSDILDAAERVFARKGADKATMGDIAEEARLSRGLIYFYFKDKDALDLAIAQRSVELLRDLFRAAVARHETGIDKIQAIGEAYVDFFKTNPFYYEQFVRYEAREVAFEDDPTATEQAYIHCGSELLGLMAEAIQAGIEDGSIRDDLGSPMKTAITLWGMTHGVLQIGAMKASMLDREYHLGLDALAAHTIEMAGRALAPDP